MLETLATWIGRRWVLPALALLAITALANDLGAWVRLGPVVNLPTSVMALLLLLCAARVQSSAIRKHAGKPADAKPADTAATAPTHDRLLGAVAFVDRTRRCSFVSATLARWLGATPAEIEGHAIEVAFGPTNSAKLRQQLDSALAGNPHLLRIAGQR